MHAISSAVANHPCFSQEAHSRCGRIHLPVAPACNLDCAYCERVFDCANESRPGVTSRVLTPDEAVVRMERALAIYPAIRVAGIAGPGEPLYNEETFATLALLRERFPAVQSCVGTNGLLLADRVDDLARYGVKTITVTVNTLKGATASRIYGWKGGAADMLLKRQREGLACAVRRHLAVKLNMVLIPGVNLDEAEEVAGFAAEAGVFLMNVIPLIPCGKMSEISAPTDIQLFQARTAAARHISQFTHCRRCRADAVGIPGKEAITFL